MLARFIVALALGLSSMACPAREADEAGASPLARSLKALRHTALTPQDGAPSDIRDIAQTPDGFLWLSTASGLVRYDGVRFLFDVAPGMPHRGARSVLAVGDDDIWVGYFGGGVAHLSGRKVALYDGDLPDGTVVALKQTPDGTLWAATITGIARWRQGRWQAIPASAGYAPRRPEAMAVDPGGVLWIQDAGKAYRWNGNDELFEPASLDALTALYRHLPADGQWQPDRVDGAVMKDSSGAYWVTAQRGLCRYRAGGPSGTARAQAECMERRDGLSSGYINGFFEDREHNVWVLTDRGLDRFRGSRLTPVPLDGETHNLVMAAAPGGGAWIAGALRPPCLVTDTMECHPEFGDGISALHVDAAGTLWMAGTHGIARYARGRRESIPGPPELQGRDARYRSLAVDADGALWAIASGQGVYRWRDGQWQRGGGIAELATGTPLMLQADGQRLWLGYPKSRMALLEHGKLRFHTAADGLDLGSVQSAFVAGGRVWLSGSDGIGALVKGAFVPLHLDPPELLVGASGIAQTADGELWINASRGLFRIPATEVDKALADRTYKASYEFFDQWDGLDGVAQQSVTLPTLRLDPSGTLWASTSGGIVRFDPHHIARSAVPPQPVIEGITSEGVDYGTREVVLPASTRNIRINFTAATLSVPEHARFEFRLSRSEKGWQPVANVRQAYLVNLDPGNYRFEVRAANEDSDWASRSAVAEFRILPEWYRTAWFHLALVLLAAAAGWLVYASWLRRKTARLRIKYAERERIARELHDSLIQNLHGLILVLDHAGSRLGDEAARKFTADCAQNLRSVVEEARDKVNEIRPQSRGAVEWVQAVAQLGRAAAREYAIAFELHISGDPVALRREASEELLQIAREMLLNAFRHAHATAIVLALEFGRKQFALCVRDDGDGMPPEIAAGGEKPMHWGIKGMRERAANLGGRFQMASHAAGGTEVKVSVPAARAYVP